MDPRKLRYFLAVAEELHFGRAARRLNISQPPLSMQIRALEDELEALLFTRDRRNVALTEAGRVLLVEARNVLVQIDHARNAVQRAARGEVGRLAIGFITPVEYNVLPPLLGEFRRSYPGISLSLREVMTDQQLAELESGTLDVGLLTAPVDRPTLWCHRVWRERMIVAMGAADVDAHECLGHVLRSVQRIAMNHPVVPGAILDGVAGRGDEFRHKLIPWFIDCHAVANPVVIAPHLLVRKVIARNQQQIGPLIRPVIHKLGPLHEAFNQLIPLIW